MLFKFKIKEHIAIKIFLLVVIVLSTTRLVMVYSMNQKYIRNMEYDKTLGQAKYYSYEKGYCFKYAKANFFHTDCFASVSKEEDMKLFMDENGNVYTDGMQITFYIWPYSNEYGVDFYQDQDGIEINMQIMVDEELNYFSEEGSELDKKQGMQLLSEYRKDIVKLRREAERKWGLNLEKM